MTGSMPIITRWNKLFDWRLASVATTDALVDAQDNKTYFLSANAWGLKGKLPGARHTWIASFKNNKWQTYEMTDIETVEVQGGNILYAKYNDKNLKQLIVSDRDPAAMWFGNKPRIDFRTDYLEISADEYPMNMNVDLITNNCNTFISYVVWKNKLDYSPKYVGFKSRNFWSVNYLST